MKKFYYWLGSLFVRETPEPEPTPWDTLLHSLLHDEGWLFDEHYAKKGKIRIWIANGPEYLKLGDIKPPVEMRAKLWNAVTARQLQWMEDELNK